MDNHIITSDGRWVTIRDDELYHYKYIKREKVNGKWRYYYKDDAYDKASDELDAATAELDHRTRAVQRTRDQHNNTWKRLEDARKEVTSRGEEWVFSQEFWDYDHATYKSGKANLEAHDKYYESQRKANRASENYRKARKKYNNAAGHKVADLLNRSSDKIDKAKKWVTRLLSKKK